MRSRWLRRERAARGVAATLLACLVCGCVQQGGDSKPDIEAPSAYRFDDRSGAAAAAVDGRVWWRGFNAPQLDALICEALFSNRDLRIATARVDEFAAILTGTRSQGYPQIGVGASASRKRATERGGIPTFSDPRSSSFDTLLSASWEIDLWGRIRRETEAARANLLASSEAREGVVLTVIASVITSYVTLLDLDEQLRVAQATAASRGQTVELFETRLQGGWISELEMAQVRASYEATVTRIPALRTAIATQENALSILLGRNPGPIERDTTLDALYAPAVPAGLPSELLVRRPDIRGAEQQLSAANALIGAARAQFFPRVSLTGALGFASASLGNLFTGPARTWSFTGDVSGPIYTGGGLGAALDQAEARRDQSLASYERVVQNAFRDVEDSLVRLQNSREIQQSLQRGVSALRRTVELATTRYENGYSDYLEVLDSERSLFSTQLQLAAAQGDYYRALAALYLALGGDWISADGSLPAKPLSIDKDGAEK